MASGRAARWNSGGSHLIYTAGSVSLACLENLVHRQGTDMSRADFSLVTIEIPETVPRASISPGRLDKLNHRWFEAGNYHITRTVGDEWLSAGQETVLQVPSAVIHSEYNYLLNPGHPDFSGIRIAGIQKYTFDNRLG